MHRYQESGLVHNSLEDTVQRSTILLKNRFWDFWVSFRLSECRVQYVGWYAGCGQAHRLQNLAGLGLSFSAIYCVTLAQFPGFNSAISSFGK